MRQLFRRLAGIVLSLGIVLSMPGVAHASCTRAAGVAAGARSDAATHQAHAAHGAAMADMPEHEPTSPAGCDDGTRSPSGDGVTACTLVAHCVTMMPAASGEVAIAAAPADARRAPTNDAGPLAPALEPDSPPPRG